MDAKERIIEICRDYIAQFSKSIELMRAGRMGTSGWRNERMVDTTQETISEQLALIAKLEDTIAEIETHA